MMMETVANRLTLTTCAECSIQFAVPEQWDENRRQTGSTFWCPNGHILTYKSEIKRLRSALQAEQTRVTAMRDQLQAAERSARAVRGQVTKLKKRIANGVCPCCHRSFADLHRHMTGQHPGYAADETP
jgi:hypothetical protein